MRAALYLGIACLVVILSQPTNQASPQKEGGFRQWLGGKLGLTTTTTTTLKPNLLNRAQSYYQEQKDKAKKLLDPRTIAAKTIASAIQGG